MTLLSIREQEAVKRAAAKFGRALDGGSTVANAQAILDARDELYREVILATRNAIARQVREQASGRGKGASDVAVTRLLGWMDAAAFIEGLPL